MRLLNADCIASHRPGTKSHDAMQIADNRAMFASVVYGLLRGELADERAVYACCDAPLQRARQLNGT